MSVQAHSLTLTDEVYYLADNVSYVVRQPDPERTIAVLEITVRNDRSDEVRVDVGPDASRLVDEDSDEYRPIDPFDTRGASCSLLRTLRRTSPTTTATRRPRGM